MTLDRPEAKNAVDPAMYEALCAAWSDFDADDAVDVAILSGVGGTFCSGADLKSYVPLNYVEATPARVREIVDLGLGGPLRLLRGAARLSPRRRRDHPRRQHLWHRRRHADGPHAEPIDAERALACNMVTSVVPADQLLAEAERVAAQILRNSQRAVRSAKETILGVIGKPLDDQLRLEGWNSYSCLDPAEANELLKQFYERTDSGREGS